MYLDGGIYLIGYLIKKIYLHSQCELNQQFAKFDLTGKVALVTGGAYGIGYAMAKALVNAGAKIAFKRNRDRGKDTCPTYQDSRGGRNASELRLYRIQRGRM